MRGSLAGAASAAVVVMVMPKGVNGCGCQVMALERDGCQSHDADDAATPVAVAVVAGRGA